MSKFSLSLGSIGVRSMVGMLLAACGTATAQTCQTCSAETGRHCFTVQNQQGQVITASCTGRVQVTVGEAHQIQIQVRCEDITVGYSMQHTYQTTQVLAAPECKKCSMQVCFPSSTLTVEVCKFTYPDWDCPEPVCRQTRPCRYLGMTTQTIVTKHFEPGGEVEYTNSCEDYSCQCKAQGFNCECATQGNGTNNSSSSSQGPRMAYFGPAIYEVNADQFNRGLQVNGPAASLADLSLFQLQMLKDVIMFKLSKDTTFPRFAVTFSPSSAIEDDAWKLLETVKNASDDLSKSTRLYDFNRDGVVNSYDRTFFDAFYILSQSGQPWPITLDVDGDGSLTERDKCQVYTNVAAQ